MISCAKLRATRWHVRQVPFPPVPHSWQCDQPSPKPLALLKKPSRSLHFIEGKRTNSTTLVHCSYRFSTLQKWLECQQFAGVATDFSDTLSKRSNSGTTHSCLDTGQWTCSNVKDMHGWVQNAKWLEKNKLVLEGSRYAVLSILSRRNWMLYIPNCRAQQPMDSTVGDWRLASWRSAGWKGKHMGFAKWPIS